MQVRPDKLANCVAPLILKLTAEAGALALFVGAVLAWSRLLGGCA